MEMVHFIPPGQRRLVMLAAQADSAPVLIFGASGTGKGAIARWIHSNSVRSAHPLAVAKPDLALVEQIPEANHGTLVIPEIGERPLSEQVALFKFLKTKAVPHFGSADTPMLINARIIATSSQSLEGRAQGGLFKPELLEKLNVFRIEMPALAKRTEEFSDIVLGILGEITRELHKEHLRGLAGQAWELLRSYDWPGNLRELRNVLKIATIVAKGDKIEALDLPQFGHRNVDFRATREQFERIYILELLKAFDWEIDKTCQMTKVNKDALLSKIDKYGLKRPTERQPIT